MTSKPRTDLIQCEDCGRWLAPRAWIAHWHEVQEVTPLIYEVEREPMSTHSR